MPVNPSSYQDLIPQPTDQLSVSQGDLLNNFGAIKTLIDQNHVDFVNGIPQAGKHNFVQMPIGPGIPTGGFLVGEDTLSAVSSLMSGKSEMVFTRGTGVAIGPIVQTYEMTTYGTGTVSSGGINYSYVWSRFPSGLLQLWGTQTNTGPVIGVLGTTVPFPAINIASSVNPFPGFGAVYSVQLTMQWNDGTGANSPQALIVVQSSLTTTSFVYTREQQNSFSTKGSILFSVIGI